MSLGNPRPTLSRRHRSYKSEIPLDTQRRTCCRVQRPHNSSRESQAFCSVDIIQQDEFFIVNDAQIISIEKGNSGRSQV